MSRGKGSDNRIDSKTDTDTNITGSGGVCNRDLRGSTAVDEGEIVVKRRLLSGAAVLAAGSIAAKIIGALYRIPLTNILGAEGMGMYQLVFPVYALFMVLATAGIPTALSRIVAEKRAEGESTKKYLASAMIILVLLSSVAALLTVGLSRNIAQWQGNTQTSVGFAVIAPSILFVGIIAGLRGWFQGEMYMLPTALSNIIEQLVKLGVGIGLAVVLMPRGIVAAVCGALAGVSVSELVAAIYLAITYAVRGKKLGKQKLRVNKTEAREMFRIAFPIALIAALMPLSNFIDSMIIVNVLKWGGAQQAAATADYGLLSGPVNSLINMPIVVIMSLAIAIVPAVSASRVERDIDGIMLKSRLSIKLTYLIGIPCALFYIAFAREIISVIYPALSVQQIATAKNLLLIAASNVVILSAMQIYVSLLQALDRTKIAVLTLVCAILVKTALNIVLVKYIGIYGAAIGSIAMGVVALAGVNIAFVRLCGLHLEKNIGINMLCGVIMALAAYGAAYFVKGSIASLVVGFVVAAAVYVWLAFLLGLIGKEDIPFLPMRRLIAALHRIIRFWEYKKDET